MSRTLQPGDVIDALFPGHDPKGREQEGYRPAVVVGLPETLGTPRYLVILVVPLTSDQNQPWADNVVPQQAGCQLLPSQVPIDSV